MNTQNVNPNLNQEVAETPNPNPSSHTLAAQAMLERVEAWHQEIPQFSFSMGRDRRTMLSARLVPPETLERAAVAMLSIDSLSRGNIGGDQLRDLAQYAIAYGPVADAIVELGKAMQRSVDTARAKAGSEALITYRLAQHLVEVPGNEHLVPVVADMRRTLEIVPRFRARRAAKKDGAEPAASSPAPATPAAHPLN
jgi:hypothetical protein